MYYNIKLRSSFFFSSCFPAVENCRRTSRRRCHWLLLGNVWRCISSLVLFPNHVQCMRRDFVISKAASSIFSLTWLLCVGLNVSFSFTYSYNYSKTSRRNIRSFWQLLSARWLCLWCSGQPRKIPSNGCLTTWFICVSGTVCRTVSSLLGTRVKFFNLWIKCVKLVVCVF